MGRIVLHTGTLKRWDPDRILINPNVKLSAGVPRDRSQIHGQQVLNKYFMSALWYFLDTLVEPLNPHNNELLLYIKCFPVCINWITCYKVDILCSALLGFSIKQVNVLPCSFKWTWDCVFVCSGCYKQKNATVWASHKQLSKPGDWGPRSTYHRDGVLVKDTNLIHKASVLWPKHLPKSPAFYWPYFQGLGFQHVNFEGPQHSYPSRQGWALSWEESEKTR